MRKGFLQGYYDERTWLWLTAMTDYPDSVVVLTRHMLWQENVKAQMAISFSESDTGLIYWRQKRYADSIQHYRRAAAIRASLHAADPADDRARWSLWSVSQRLGRLQLEAGERREAIDWLLKAEKLARPAGALTGADAKRLEEWIESCNDLVRVYGTGGRQGEALPWVQRALEGCAELERRNQMTPEFRAIAEKLRQQGPHL